MQTPIPQRMIDLDQWLTWIYSKGTKMPCSTKSGDVCDATEPTNWSTYKQSVIAAATRKHAGPAFSFAEDDGLSGVDLDDCRDPKTGIIEPWAQDIITRFNSYSEISPSKTGVKIFCGGKVEKNVKTKQIEVYSRVRFFTVTGDHLEGTPTDIRDAQAELTALAESLRPKQTPQPNRTPVTASADSNHCRRYAVAALESEHESMRLAVKGERHNMRNRAAYALAGYIPYITEDEITAALAVNFGDNEDVARKTISDGIKAGRAAPRDIPEPKQPRFDVDGYACCPTHGDHMVASRNGNGYHCPHANCFWWLGENYSEPAEVTIDELDSLDADTLRRRLRAVIAERDRLKVHNQQLEVALDQVKDHNRFMTDAHSADIATAGKRLTFIELKKEIDRVPVEEREEGQWVRIRQTTMAHRTNQNPGTISKHIKEFKTAGWVETAVKRIQDPEAKNGWRSETFVRPLVDLNNPAVISLPAKPRGRRTCSKCGSDQLVREVKIICAGCQHEEVSQELVNRPDAELQTETQNEDAADFFEQMPAPLNCDTPCIESASVLSSELQIAIHSAGPVQPPPKQQIILPNRYKQFAIQRRSVTS